MKLNSDRVWTITPKHLKILEAAEELNKTHPHIPVNTLRAKSNVRGEFNDLIVDLVEDKLITYRDKMYKLSISGMDCLAITALRRKGLDAMGTPIGIGKESDIYFGVFNKKDVVIKIHRLGRTSYMKVDERNFKNDRNWYELNKENCKREAEFLGLFGDLDVPRVIASERHAIVMELLGYDTLYRVRVENPEIVSRKMFEFIRRLYEKGYVHGDFNEFNVMVLGDNIKVIDFPQCIPLRDEKARDYLKRDIECVHSYFWRKYFLICDDSALRDIIAENKIVIEVARPGEGLVSKKIIRDELSHPVDEV